jgi:hypothetical protein
MKRITNDELDKALRQLLDQGEIVVGNIRVDDGESIASYTTLSACPPEHREGFRRALETAREAYIRDVVYEPILIATEHAISIATLQ